MRKYIGIDLGGTNVRAAVVDEYGNILCEKKTRTEADKGPDHVCEKVMTLVKEVMADEVIQGIGIGYPGPIEAHTNDILMSTNIPGMEHYPITRKLQETFKVPVYIDNDANVAGLAEALVGAGKEYPSIYYVTISTGIGGAFILDGKVISGRHGHAGEIGNIIIDRDRKKYNHLNAGVVENEASGTAIVRKGKEVFGDTIEHAGHVFDLARQGNTQALEIVENVARDLAYAFSAIAHAVDPHAFIIGGGVMAAKDVFFDKMITYYKEAVHTAMQDIEFKQAQLEEPGIIGAAMLPKSKEN
ncbi:MAG: ROK family protein [Erysipelotrichales bacterium]|nr:ROK family protein [Erysipelotrichales bacterium]